MIKDTLSRHRNPSLTSDRWHVVHSRWNGEDSDEPRFARSIVSEHDDRASAVVAARSVEASLAAEMAQRPPERKDQVFVRKPDFKSLKLSKRTASGRE